MDAASNLKCVDGLAEIIELLLVLYQETPDLSIKVHIRSSTDHENENLIFLIKLICNRHICFETLFSNYGNYLQKFSSLVFKMQSLENESHLSTSYREDGTLTRKSYLLVSDNDGNGLKCTKSKTKPDTKRTTDTVLHIRVFQTKSALMLQAKKLYHYMKQISLCSKASLALSLTVHENDCIFDIRPSMIKDLPEKGYSLSTDTAYILKDTQYVPSSLPTKIVSGNMKELPNLHDAPDMTFQFFISGYKTVCLNETNTPSLVMLSWYGPGNIPLYGTGDAINQMKVLSFVKWTKYGIQPVLENPMQSKSHQPCHESLLVRAKREHSCFVLSLFAYLDVKSLCNSERKMDAVFWLRKNIEKWMEIYKEKITASLEFIINNIVTPLRTAYDEKTTLQYSQAIANISKSISNVVLRSTCEQFRRKCYQLLEVEDDGSVQESLSKGLWNITKSFGIFQPTDTMESGASCDTETVMLDATCQSEFRSSGTDTLEDKDFIQYHEDEFKRLNWIPGPREATETKEDIPDSNTAAASFEKTQLSKSMSKIFGAEASSAGNKPQVELTNNNGGFEKDVATPEQDLVKKVNLQSVLSSKENGSIHQDENCILAMNEHQSPSQNGKNLYIQYEDMNREDHFDSVMEAEEEWDIAGVEDELRKCADAEEQTLSNSALGSDFRTQNIHQQHPTLTQTAPHSIAISETLEKERAKENLDDWLDDALLEMKNWFNDE